MNPQSNQHHSPERHHENIEINYFHFIALSAPSALQTDGSIFYERYLYGRDENSSKNGRRQRQQIRPRKVVDFDGTFQTYFW